MLTRLCEALAAVGVDYFYGRAPEKQAAPYIVYVDYAENYNYADDRINEVYGSVQVDYFTAADFDGKKEALREALDERGFEFETRHFYEADKKLHHYVFDISNAQ